MFCCFGYVLQAKHDYSRSGAGLEEKQFWPKGWKRPREGGQWARCNLTQPVGKWWTKDRIWRLAKKARHPWCGHAKIPFVLANPDRSRLRCYRGELNVSWGILIRATMASSEKQCWRMFIAAGVPEYKTFQKYLTVTEKAQHHCWNAEMGVNEKSVGQGVARAIARGLNTSSPIILLLSPGLGIEYLYFSGRF